MIFWEEWLDLDSLERREKLKHVTENLIRTVEIRDIGKEHKQEIISLLLNSYFEDLSETIITSYEGGDDKK